MQTLDAKFISHLEAGGTVLTANRRQSRIIGRRYDESRLAAGLHCWPAAAVMPLDAWLAAQWRRLAGLDAGLPMLLDEAETLWPWRVCADRHLDPGLVALPDLASAARRAWVQLYRHGASLDDLEGEVLTRDQRQFLAWSRDVERRLAAGGWEDPGRLETLLADRASGMAPLPGLLLAGFERPAPSLVALMERLSAQGVDVDWTMPTGEPGETRLHAAADTADETRSWLTWTRQRLEARPDARLAVVVPDLQARRRHRAGPRRTPAAGAGAAGNPRARPRLRPRRGRASRGLRRRRRGARLPVQPRAPDRVHRLLPAAAFAVLPGGGRPGSAGSPGPGTPARGYRHLARDRPRRPR